MGFLTKRGLFVAAFATSGRTLRRYAARNPRVCRILRGHLKMRGLTSMTEYVRQNGNRWRRHCSHQQGDGLMIADWPFRVR
jgi:hypothetical protein